MKLPSPSLTLFRPIVLVILVEALMGCGGPAAPQPATQRLVEVFESRLVTGTAAAGEVPVPTEWRFENASAAADTLGWEGFEGIEGLQVRDGRLIGRTTRTMPILRVTREGGEDTDPLHEVRLRMKVSAGTDTGMSFYDRLPPAQVLRLFWSANGAIIADGEMRTYSLRTSSTVTSSNAREIFLRPTNAPGVEFEIESVRLVFRREHLAEQPSGVGWYGLGGDFRETVVTRAPETIRWSLTLPDQARLELGLGTLDQNPMTFRVALDGQGGEALLLRRSLASPDGWEDLTVDLAAYAGREVTLLLTLDAETGTPGLWGAPAIRQQVAPGSEDVQGVILILADTLRPDRLSFYGHERPTAPRLGRLAQEGALFRDAHAHAPWTRVSAPSIVTSLYPLTHGLQGFFDRLPNSAFTLAEAYRTAGWATVGFSSIPHTGRSANMHQGYESLHELPWMGHSKTALEFVDRLLPWLDRHQRERFFVFLHVFDPHFPYPPISADDALWSDPSRDDEIQRQAQEIAKHAADPLKGGMGQATREELERAGVDAEPYIEHHFDWYDGSIRGMDEQLGRLFEHLQKLGLADQTLIAFTSDHGEEFLEHDWMGHGHSLYDEVIHVPLLLWKPGLVPEGQVIDKPAQHVDLMPTLLELSGLAVPETVQGQSLAPLLAAAGEESRQSRHGTWRERPTIIERLASEHPASPAPRDFSSTALIFDGWKLIQHGEGRGDRPEHELYNHHDDPQDRHDVATERPEVVARLADLLAAWRREAAAQQLETDAELGQDLSQDELERLRSLGYIQ